MSARRDILNRLGSQRRDTSHPDPWTSQIGNDQLVDRFSTALTRAGGEVYQAKSLEEALAHVEQVMVALDARRIVANVEPPLDRLDLPARWPAYQWHRVETSGEQGSKGLRDFCASADLGLSGSEGGLAETGTVIVNSGVGKSRLATLLPPVHLALVPAGSLYGDIFSWTAARRGAFPANLTLISGPSKTADIEQTLTVGVHGPKRMIVILYE